jgi:hypothetical protein
MTFEGKRLPVTYREHTKEFSGRGEGFAEQTDFNLFIATVIMGDLIAYGEIQDRRIAYFADMILNSVYSRN